MMWNKLLGKYCKAGYTVKDVALSFIVMLLQFSITLMVFSIAVLYNLHKLYYLMTLYYFMLAAFPGLIGIFGIILLMSALSMSDCYALIYVKFFAISTLVYSSIFTGVSMAFLVTYLIYLIIKTTRFPHSASLNFLITTIMLIPTLFQMSFVVLFSEKEVNVLGGNLTITAIGVLAMSMGMMLPAIQLPQSTINFSTIAGPIIGSGLTLIAVGLQRYYEERQSRNQMRRRRPRLY